MDQNNGHTSDSSAEQHEQPTSKSTFSSEQVTPDQDVASVVNLNYDLKDMDNADMDNLRKELVALRKDKTELERKRFVDNSLSRFTEIMRLRVDSKLESWADNLLAELVPFVEGLQAALFMVDELENGEQKLRCIGGYAMPKDALRELEIGQGVTGQAAKNGKVLYFSSDDNFESHTESSLSKIDAEVLLVQPLIQNEQVEGVLELTSLDALTTEKLDFLAELSGSMAGTLVTLRNQVRIQDLFLEAQQRQEELQAQEEEMRQNVEELQATQEEMKRLQKQAESSEKRIRSMMNNIPIGVIVMLDDRTPFFANTEAERLLERDFNEIDRITRFTEEFNLKKAGSEESYANEEAIFEAVAAGEKKQFDDVELLKKNGTRIPLELTGAAVKNDQGHIAFFIITLADTTQRRLQEQEIRAQNEELGAREEEMRQNLEELEATQEQMKHMQQRAERQKLILDAILDSNDNTIIAVDTKMNILTVNKVVRDQYEASGIKIKPGKPIFDYLPEEQHESYNEKFGRALKGERFSESIENKRDGATTYYEIDYYPIKSRRDEIIGATSVASDVSERFEQLNMLREIQRSLTIINEVTPILEFTPEGIIQRVNQKAQDLLGYTADELISKHHRILVPKHIQESEAYQQMWEKLSAGEMQKGTFERVSKSGETIYMQGSYSPVFDNNGELYRVAKVAVNVTKEVAQGAEAAHAEQQLQKLVEQAPIGVCVTKPDYTFEQVNQAYLDIYGFKKPEEVIGKPFTIVTRDEEEDFWKKKHDDFLAGEDETLGRFTVKNTKGEEMVIHADSTRIMGPDGEPRKVTYVVDINDLQVAGKGSMAKGDSMPSYLPAGAWSWNLKDDSVVLSEALRSLLGHTKRSWKQDKDYLLSLIHPDDLPTFNALADDYLAGKNDQHNQKLRLKQKGGEYLDMRNCGELVKDADDKPLMIRGHLLAC